MRALRVSLFSATSCMTTIITDKDLKPGHTLDELAEPPPEAAGCFALSEMYDVPDDSTPEAVAKHIVESMQPKHKDEQNMALAYYFNAMRLYQLSEHGVLSSTTPAPLSAEQLRVMLKQLAKHPAYKAQTVIQLAKDFTIVKLEKGELVEAQANPKDAG